MTTEGQRHRLVAVIRRPYTGEPSRHYVGLPPMEPGDTDTRERMSVARVLVVQPLREGVFLFRYDEMGDDAGDTWHLSIEDAKEQAGDEYGENLGPWTEVPGSEDDAVAFALRLAGADHG